MTIPSQHSNSANASGPAVVMGPRTSPPVRPVGARRKILRGSRPMMEPIVAPSDSRSVWRLMVGRTPIPSAKYMLRWRIGAYGSLRSLG